MFIFSDLRCPYCGPLTTLKRAISIMDWEEIFRISKEVVSAIYKKAVRLENKKGEHHDDNNQVR